MSYTTKQEMIDRFGTIELAELTDRTNAAVIDDQVLNQAIKDADAVINAHLQGRYQVPMVDAPDILITYASDIARYNLYDDAAPEQVTRRKDDALKFLQMVGTGKLNLGVNSAGETEADDNTVQFEGGGNVFDRKDDSFI